MNQRLSDLDCSIWGSDCAPPSSWNALANLYVLALASPVRTRGGRAGTRSAAHLTLPSPLFYPIPLPGLADRSISFTTRHRIVVNLLARWAPALDSDDDVASSRIAWLWKSISGTTSERHVRYLNAWSTDTGKPCRPSEARTITFVLLRNANAAAKAPAEENQRTSRSGQPSHFRFLS